MRGLSDGLPLARKIAATAAGLVASAAMPYTVSVGITATCPSRIARAAWAMAVGVGVVWMEVFMSLSTAKFAFTEKAHFTTTMLAKTAAFSFFHNKWRSLKRIIFYVTHAIR